MQTITSQKSVSEFMSRLLAFVIDSVLLIFIGFGLSFCLFDLFVSLGSWGCLLGFCIVMAYFGILNSNLGKGKTVGKWIMGIMVVDQKGNHISLVRSCMRSMIFGFPFFLFAAMIPLHMTIIFPFDYFLRLFLFGCIAEINYLFIVNRQTRQNPHDIICRTLVIKSDSQGSVVGSTRWYHFLIIGIWLCCVIFLAYGFFCIMALVNANDTPPSFLARVQKELQSSGLYHDVRAYNEYGPNTDKKSPLSMVDYYCIDVILSRKPSDSDNLQPEAMKIAQYFLENFHKEWPDEILDVNISYGFDIGFLSYWKHQNYLYTINEWKNMLGHENQKETKKLNK